MQTVRRNQTKMLYSLYLSQSDVMDFYEDEEGNRYPIPTGEKEPVFSTPQEMRANLSMSGGEAEAREYGLSVADFSAIALYSLDAYPIVEGAYIWVNSPVIYEYEGEEIEVDDGKGGKVWTKAPLFTSADYKVVRVADSLNFTKVILKSVNK